MPIKLYFHNRIEVLAEVFNGYAASRNKDLTPLQVIVPNPYIKKWLQLTIAADRGVCANIQFNFLDQGLFKIISTAAGDDEAHLLEISDITLLIQQAVMDLLDDGAPEMKPFEDYLNSKAEKNSFFYQKLLQLSERLARIFVEYEYSREEMINNWMQAPSLSADKIERAESLIYRTIFLPGGLKERLDSTAWTLPRYFNTRTPDTLSPLDNEIFIFAESLFTPFHVHCVYELSKQADITIFHLNPCVEFWEDVTTPGEDRSRRKRYPEYTAAEEIEKESPLENPLLKIWGRAGRETIRLLGLLEDAGMPEMRVTSEWPESESIPPGRGVLHAVQESILHREQPQNGPRAQDRTLQIIACSDIFREVTGVYNSIINNLRFDPALKTTDIAVMVPEMESYAPVIEAVFSQDPGTLPYSIIDSSSRESLYANAVTTFLELCSGEITRKDIFALLYNPCFMAAQGVTTVEVDIWLEWVDQLNIFFDDSREQNDTTHADSPFTWEYGLKRFRLGRIMSPPAEFESYRGLVPFSSAESADISSIDTFNQTMILLLTRLRSIRQASLIGTEWYTRLTALVTEFLAVPEDRPEEAPIFSAFIRGLKRIKGIDSLSGDAEPEALPFALVKQYIINNLSGIPFHRGSYLSSGINVSTLIPKRQVPFKVTYILGMQEGAFPGSAEYSSLDLRNKKYHPGDINPLEINRYIFLEALISTREKLYITYISKNLKKGEDLYPNSVTGQLISFLNSFLSNQKFSIANLPLTPESPEYLKQNDNSLKACDFLVYQNRDKKTISCYLSTDRLFLLTALEKAGHRITEKTPDREGIHSLHMPLLSNKETAAITGPVMIDDIKSFLINPLDYALEKRLKLYEEPPIDHVGRREYYYSEFPHNYNYIIGTLKERIEIEKPDRLDSLLEQKYAFFAKQGAMPWGAFGEADYRKLSHTVKELVQGNEAFQGLDRFLRERKNLHFYRNILMGEAFSDRKPHLAFSALSIDLAFPGKYPVKVNGLLPYLWVDKEKGTCETLVLTKKSGAAVGPIIPPFIFYVCAVSGFNSALADLFGDGPFTIHLLHAKGIDSIEYHLSKEECRSYSSKILRDLLDIMNFDLLPLQVIENNKKLYNLTFSHSPTEEERKRYRETLTELIENEISSPYSSFCAHSYFSIIGPYIPHNAYDKVRDRLMPILGPFIDAMDKKKQDKKKHA